MRQPWPSRARTPPKPGLVRCHRRRHHEPARRGEPPAQSLRQPPTDDNRAAFCRSHRAGQQWLREMQDTWTARKAEAIQGYADRSEWKNFFSAIKAIYGPLTKGTAPLLSADGSTLLTGKANITALGRTRLKRPQPPTHHLRCRNRSSAASGDQRRPRHPPTLHENIRAVQQLSSGKAPESDATPTEIYSHGGPQLMDHLTAIFQEGWRQGEAPLDFKDTIIVHLYKRKENRQLFDNHRGVSLLNIAWKIFARITLSRLNNHPEESLLPESQCGFRCHRGTTDMSFAAYQLQEWCQEICTHLYFTFADPTKGFDTVNPNRLWKVTQKFGCPERFTQVVR
ncbi:hypothetical protein SprV_0702278100 [Sparganum proliferum]